MKRVLILLWVTISVLVYIPKASATHIVGGEITYKFVRYDIPTQSNIYQIEIDLYQDCINGLPAAIQQDNPAIISIFNLDDSIPPYYRTVYSIEDSLFHIVPANFNNTCVKNPPQTCLRKTYFVKQVALKKNTNGYRVVYQRCCRNGSILNIINPSQVGATYDCTLPPSSYQNNSAVFKNYPPQIICINNPLVYDHSAYDIDGDSLTYEFCQSYAGGSIDSVKPEPSSLVYPNVVYRSPYTFRNPMEGSPRVQIDPKTGLITGTPNLLGRFVVTVCCHEYRGGVLINTVHREFQFVVTNCSKAVIAEIPQLSTEFNTYLVQCKGYKVHFINKSIGGFSYHWDFGVPGTNADTSNQFEPDFTYPADGVYEVSLVVNKGTTCPDSITRYVKVYPEFHADFKVTDLLCPFDPISFIDLSEATYKPINQWLWKFGDGTTSDEQNPKHTFAQGGEYNVTLIAQTEKGCVDTVTKVTSIDDFRPFAGNDTIIVKGERIYFNATGGTSFKWSPDYYLNDTNINNPVGYYTDTGTFTYKVHITTEGQCEGDAYITVRVVGQSSVFVPSAFSPNGDGLNDIFRPLAVGYSKNNFFRVYNRYGEMVFASDNFARGWDGRFNSKDCDVDTYYWVLDIKDRFGKPLRLKGDVTLVR